MDAQHTLHNFCDRRQDYENSWYHYCCFNNEDDYYQSDIETGVHERVDGWLDKALQYDKDYVFTTKCKVLHSKEQGKLKWKVKKNYSWGTYTEQEFIPEVREMFCDLACDYDRDPFCSNEWRECAWYY